MSCQCPKIATFRVLLKHFLKCLYYKLSSYTELSLALDLLGISLRVFPKNQIPSDSEDESYTCVLKPPTFYFDMAIPVLGLISNLHKPQPRHAMGRAHLMLAGIHQEVFLRQWGMPEIHLSFNHFQEIFGLGILSLNNDYSEEDPPTAWIYEKMDMFVLFRRKKLIAHFKWSELRERFKNSKVKLDSGNNKMVPSFMATTLSLFA